MNVRKQPFRRRGITMLLSLKTTDRWGAIAVIYNYYKLFLT